jgi:hypothetical protein
MAALPLGAIVVFIKKLKIQRAIATMNTGLLIWNILKPEVLSARISLSLDMRPKTRSTAVRKLQGIVKIRE